MYITLKQIEVCLKWLWSNRKYCEVTYDMLLCKKYVTIMVLGIDFVIESVVRGVEENGF